MADFQLDENKVSTLNKILGVFDNQQLTKAEFMRSFKNVVRIVLQISKKLDANYTELQAEFAKVQKSLADDNKSDLDEIKTQAQIAIAGAIKSMSDAHEARVAKLETTVKGLKNTDEEALLERMKALIPPVVAETALQTRDKLETLQGDTRLDISAIRGMEDLIAKVRAGQAEGKPVRFGFGRTGMYIFVGGKKIGVVNMVDFVPGTGMAIAYSIIEGRTTLTFTSSGGGSTVETPAGTIDGTNTQFTPTAQPQYVISDGTTYFAGAGYTWDGTHINMTIPPSSFIRDIY